MAKTLILGATVVNEGRIQVLDVLIDGEVIAKIGKDLECPDDAQIIVASGEYLLPGMIDDQVHFREPGLTHKADLTTESRAAVAGGITSYMEMPNTVPNALTQRLLQDKYDRAAEVSRANYSFYMGASNDNIDEVVKTDPRTVCGVKVFMGSSTGNMLVDEKDTLAAIFKESPTLIATHCEKEEIIRRNMEIFREKYGEDVPMSAHPRIRSAEACYRSSSEAVELAEKYGARLHILHISTARETELFTNKIPLEEKRITAEACIHHLWFTDADYDEKGTYIKWNPAIKTAADRAGIRKALNDGRIDVIATDHAPHTIEEKNQSYFKAPSGGPLVQYALPALFDLMNRGAFTPERVVEKTAHNPAILFGIEKRGFIREGYYADLVLMDPHGRTTVNRKNILSKCGWSPFEGHLFHSRVIATWVNGQLAYDGIKVLDDVRGKRLTFDR